MIKYKEAKNGDVIKLATGQQIPNDLKNKDWRAYIRYSLNGGVTAPYQETREVLEEQILFIEAKRLAMNSLPFRYLGRDYPPLTELIIFIAFQGMDLLPDDKIPFNKGKFKTANFEEDGITPIYKRLVVSEFLELKNALFERNSSNFENQENHIEAITALFIGGAEKEDLRSYDFSTGWS